MQHEAAKEQSFRMRFILSEFDSFFYLQKRKTGTWTSSLFFRAIIVVGGKREKKEIHTHHLQIKGAFFRVIHTHCALASSRKSSRCFYSLRESIVYSERRRQQSSRKEEKRGGREGFCFDDAFLSPKRRRRTPRFCRTKE